MRSIYEVALAVGVMRFKLRVTLYAWLATTGLCAVAFVVGVPPVDATAAALIIAPIILLIIAELLRRHDRRRAIIYTSKVQSRVANSSTTFTTAEARQRADHLRHYASTLRNRSAENRSSLLAVADAIDRLARDVEARNPRVATLRSADDFIQDMDTHLSAILQRLQDEPSQPGTAILELLDEKRNTGRGGGAA